MGQDWKREMGCPEIEMESIDSTCWDRGEQNRYVKGKISEIEFEQQYSYQI